MAAKVRVHELARELGLTNKECLDLCLAMGIGVKTHSSGVMAEQADKVRERAERDGVGKFAREQPLDVGLLLLEPITTREWRGVEGLLAVLWNAIDCGELTSVQQDQIIAMGQLIEAERRETEPGRTKRWRLVGVVGGALRYLAREAPKDVLAWWKLAEILSDIQWHEVAKSLPR